MSDPNYIDRAMVQRQERMIRSLDLNGDSIISRNEMRDAPYERFSGPAYALVHDYRDEVVYYEMYDEMSVGALIQEFRAGIREHLEWMDVNHDRVVTAQEYSYWRQGIRDINKDGRISQGELEYGERPLQCRIPLLNRELDRNGQCSAIREGAGVR